MSLQIQQDMEELGQYGRRHNSRFDGSSAKEKERNHDVLEQVCLKKQVVLILVNILIEPIMLLKLTLIKSLQKIVLLENIFVKLQHCRIIPGFIFYTSI